MDRLKDLLDIYNAEYAVKEDTIYLTDYGDIWGSIYYTDKDEYYHFEYGNTEIKVWKQDPHLGEYVEHYLNGFDDFVEFVEG